jgi:hypothetical protein
MSARLILGLAGWVLLSLAATLVFVVSRYPAGSDSSSQDEVSGTSLIVPASQP